MAGFDVLEVLLRMFHFSFKRVNVKCGGCHKRHLQHGYVKRRDFAGDGLYQILNMVHIKTTAKVIS